MKSRLSLLKRLEMGPASLAFFIFFFVGDDDEEGGKVSVPRIPSADW